MNFVNVTMFCVRTGLSHIEATVQALVEIIHAFTTCDVQYVGLAASLYIQLLLSTVCIWMSMQDMAFSSVLSNRKSPYC